MNVSGHLLLPSASQPLKLPIPRLSSLSAQTSTWTSSETHQIDDTTQQRTTKKPKNKRGRKPLTSMPTAKKHIQNLTNQRAFRQRRENYIRNLESKASKYEGLWKDAQSEVKTLKDKVALLEKQVDIEEGKNNCTGLSSQAISAIISDDNINSFNNNNEIKINNDDNETQPSRCFTPFTTSTSPIALSFSFNDRHRLISQQPQISCSLPMLPSIGTVENVTRDQIFCETKEDDLCLCEPSRTTVTEISSKCLAEDKQKRLMIFPATATIVTPPLYYDYPHWELTHQDDYFVSSVIATATNPSAP